MNLKDNIIQLVNNMDDNTPSIPCLYDWEADTLRPDDGTKKPTEASYKLSGRGAYYNGISDNGLYLMVKVELDKIKENKTVKRIAASERDKYIDHDEDIEHFKSLGAVCASRDECKLIKFVDGRGAACKVYKDTSKNYLVIFEDDPGEGGEFKYLKMILPNKRNGDLFSSDVI